MKGQMSLRGRVILGAVLWTAGLFIVTGVIHTRVAFRQPPAPHLVRVIFIHAQQAFMNAVPLTALAAIAMVVGFVQVRRGLSSIERLRERLASVHAGAGRRVDGRYPAEVQPLVDDLNLLLAHQEGAMRRAVAKAGDLAHGLKTPLAVLAHDADRIAAAGQSDAAMSIAQQVERMRRQIDYHLAHARAAASGRDAGARCRLVDSVDGLVRALARLHADRGLTFDVRVDPAHTVAAARQDVDEMLGNLLDNACKWARTRIAIASSADADRCVVTVDDDGPGIAAALRDAVLQRGVRADEAAPGSGLGLAIVRDLAELHDGSIALDTSPLGGLRATLALPSAR
jgi:signal transduction histidine kinase